MSFGLSQTLRVAQLTLYLRELLESDPVLTDVWVEGEVSNCTRSSSGHVYFTLRDDRAALSCVAWRNVASRWRELPREGDSLLAHGRISVYEPQGRYQLYVDLVQPAGLGRLFLEFQALKERLEAEGLFAEERKRPLPRLPQVVGVVTSSQAAALQDIVRTLQARFPALEVLLAPTLVQGPQAPAQIVRALQALDARAEVDVIVLARGGGSLEDLWAFNDEALVRAIADCEKPVISAVGHESDVTLADFAADMRAPTPSAAAELAVPIKSDLVNRVDGVLQALLSGTERELMQKSALLSELTARLQNNSPAQTLALALSEHKALAGRLHAAVSMSFQRLQNAAEAVLARLTYAGPSQTLERGYVIALSGDNPVTRAKDAPGEMTLMFQDGRVQVKTLTVSLKDKEIRHEHT